MEQNETIEAVNSAAASAAAEMAGKYLTFRVDSQLFAVPIAQVEQIIGIQEITVMPEYPSYAKGIINLRDSVIPVIDMRLRFSLPEVDYNDRTCIIITQIRERFFGFIVDGVEEVADIPSNQIAPPPALRNGISAQYLTGVANCSGKMTLLLAPDVLINDEAAFFLPG